MFKSEALLLVLPTTEYQKRVPVTIGTSLTDMAVDSLGEAATGADLGGSTKYSANLSTPWKTLCCATQNHNNFRNKPSKLLNL